MLKTSFILAFFFSCAALAAPESRQCNRKQLAQKDCHLELLHYQLQIWNDKIFLNDKVSRDLESLPLTGNAVEWEKIQLRTIAGRSFLELNLWDDPEANSDVQSLHWYVIEIHDGRLVKKVEQLVQKRKITQGLKDKKFQYDKRLTTDLIHKNKKIYYRIGKHEVTLH